MRHQTDFGRTWGDHTQRVERAHRPRHPLRLVGIAVLSWIFLSSICSPLLEHATHLFRGPLSAAEQAAFARSNRELILEQVGLPDGAVVWDTWEVARTNDEEEVLSFDTTFRLNFPEVYATMQKAVGTDSVPTETKAFYAVTFYGPVSARLQDTAHDLERQGFKRDRTRTGRIRTRRSGRSGSRERVSPSPWG